MTDQPAGEQSKRREYPPTKDLAVRLFIAAAMFGGLGGYCLIDDMAGKYPYAPPAEDLNTFLKFAFNHYGPYVFIPLGVLLGIWGIVALRRKLIIDDEGIGYATGRKIKWSDITKIDASQLQKKGLLFLHHGPRGQLKLDSWKIQNFRNLVELVEKYLPAELNEPFSQ